MFEKFKLDTQCVLEYDDNVGTKPHILPIYATSSFELENMSHGIDVFTGKKAGHVYGRYGNPTIDTTAQKIAEMEGFGTDLKTYGFMTSSGMSAISVLMQSLLKQGEAIITQADLYGGTTELFSTVFSRFDIKTHYVDLNDFIVLENILQNDPMIKVLYVETPSNPVCSCIDLKSIVAICRKYGILSVVDNTFCTPYIQRPFLYGIDFVIHSTTKYLNGHGNSIAGAIVGWREDYKNVIWKFLKLTGATCNAFDAWLVYNGIKTLGLRMERHSTNAMELATFLANHSKVKKVNYVGLPDHKSHQIAKLQMSLYGGMLSFEVAGDRAGAMAFMDSLVLATYAPTLGDVNTLVLHPRTSSHLNVDQKTCEDNGITEGLIRVSVGIENIQDIISDFNQALEKL